MQYVKPSAFTLIELVVSITIFGIVMMSIFSIFVLGADMNNKTDISRSMQENVKNIVDIISEDIRKYTVVGVSVSGSTDCTIDSTTFTSGDKLCVQTSTGEMHTYYVAKKDARDVIIRVDDHSSCSTLEPCFLAFYDANGPTKLSNDWVDFRSLRFDVIGQDITKVVMRFQLQPSAQKGVKPALIEETKLIFQTTFSGRIYKDY